jgi:hypothetical protein
MYTQDPTPKPPLTTIDFTGTGVLLETAATLNAVQIHSCSPGAQLWALDSATGSTGSPLRPNSNLGAGLAAGITLNYGLPFQTGLSVLVAGTINATAIIQE